MNKFLLTLGFVALFSCTTILKKSNEPSVSKNKKPEFIIAPRDGSVKQVYLGYDSNIEQVLFLETLISEIGQQKEKPEVFVLVPKGAEKTAYQLFSKNIFDEEFDFLKVVSTGSNETIWTQDYFEVLQDKNSSELKILDLPYIGRESDSIPYTIGMTLKKRVEPTFVKDTNLPSNNGDFGGNIEAISDKIVVVGNNMSLENLIGLKGKINQKVIEFNVSWLNTGHVDEVFSVIPNDFNSSDQCQKTILVNSYSLARRLLVQKNLKLSKGDLNINPYYDEDQSWPDIAKCLLKSSESSTICKNFHKANVTYETVIRENIRKMQKEYLSLHSCELDVVEVPQAFLPLKINRKNFGEPDDMAVAVFPNTVNNITINSLLFLPSQNSIFDGFIQQKLQGFNYRKIFIDSNYFHELNGGIHCSSNVVY